MRKLNIENYCITNTKKGFTLAETLITLTILGVVAAITIPMLIGRQQEAANRTKVKKAMEVYEKALNNMIIENDLKTNAAIIAFGEEKDASNNPCGSTRPYFKTVEDGINNCRFKTADRIWWDISDIENPLIILKEDKKAEDVATLRPLAKDTSDITTYAFVGRIDDTNSTVRINDTSYKPGANDEGYLTKLYGFVSTKTNNDNGGGGTPTTPKTNSDKIADCITGGDPTCTITYDCATQEEPTKTCELEMAKQTFDTSNCDTLSLHLSNSCPEKPITYIAIPESNNGKSWYDSSCPDGTHIAKASELVQLWNNGAEGNVLSANCSGCYFWAQEDYPGHGESTFMLVPSASRFYPDLKESRYDENRVVCVGN